MFLREDLAGLLTNETRRGNGCWSRGPATLLR
jgi:hypothetical protein